VRSSHHHRSVISFFFIRLLYSNFSFCYLVGYCLIALADTSHSQQAAEDNEMSLVEGELIEQIEELGEGWWSGVGAGGKAGMFPGK
jgi:hypothetical protein